jgi:arylsulfatase A-like enzyme
VDTLRSDHLGCYGYERETSPSIDALAAQGHLFKRAYTTAPWTMPAVASVLTGLYPSSHGVKRISRLAGEALTLAEILGKRGYATAGVVSHTMLGEDFGFGQGFERYEVRGSDRPNEDITTGPVTDAAIEFLSGFAAGDRPFLLFVHYFDPHYHYLPHENIDFAARRLGRLDGTETIHELRAMSDDLEADEIAFIQDLYDEEIRYTDDGIGRLLAHLEELGLDDDTWVVLTADHGEEFLTHGWLGHTRTLYEELIRVPLIIRPPGGAEAPHVHRRLTTLVSLAPTLLEIAGVDSMAFDFQAASLLPLLSGGRDEPPAFAFAEVDFVPVKPGNIVKRAHKKAVVTGRLKLILDERTGKLKLFDVKADQDELRPLTKKRSDLVNELVPVLEHAIAFSRGDALGESEVALSEQQLEQLRALGYLD